MPVPTRLLPRLYSSLRMASMPKRSLYIKQSGDPVHYADAEAAIEVCLWNAACECLPLAGCTALTLSTPLLLFGRVMCALEIEYMCIWVQRTLGC